MYLIIFLLKMSYRKYIGAQIKPDNKTDDINEPLLDESKEDDITNETSENNESPKKGLSKPALYTIISFSCLFGLVIILAVVFIVISQKTVKEMNAVVEVVAAERKKAQDEDAETLQAYAEGQLAKLEEKRRQEAALAKLSDSIKELEKRKQADLDEAVANSYREEFIPNLKYKSALLNHYLRI